MKGFLPKAGGYRNLRVFKMSEAICDLTVIFIKRFVPAKSRTRDQMERAASKSKCIRLESTTVTTIQNET